VSNNVRAVSPLKIGTRVRIRSSPPPAEEWEMSPTWVDDMSYMCGRDGVIKERIENGSRPDTYRIKVGDDTYVYLVQWFEVLDE
jgi:hypothetical protein